ncbi:ComC/BlpC family peptide pheromone/bacteriocin [Streptococcus halichoeri]|uniref:ComC/BlpC family peptide pheromone/bacteriocin n=1 Tax=Streptococcus halichoeri TaxID=254785 RepID=UPI001359B713|nr:ComC/BlpC family peptide pheromone/bacteriocin [Streptococcus halichoeri]
MNTLEDYSVLNSAQLIEVKGGGKVTAGKVGKALAICTVAGGALGSVVPVVGTAAGAILGAQYCTGAWAIIRTH